MMDRVRSERMKLAMNSLSGVCLYIVNIAIAFVMSPIIVRTLGSRDYGMWEVVMSAIAYVTLLNLGVGTALVRFVSVADGKNDRAELQEIMSTALVFFMVIACIGLVVFVVLGVLPETVAGPEAQQVRDLRLVFFLTGATVALQIVLEVFIATMMGVQRHYFINYSRIVVGIAQALVLFSLLNRHPERGLAILASLSFATALLTAILFIAAVARDRTLPAFRFSRVSWSKAKELLGFGARSTIMMVASRLQFASAPIIIAHVVGLSSVVLLAIPNGLMGYAKGLALAVGYPLTPYFGAAIGRGDHRQVLQAWLTTSLVIQAIALPLPLIILFFGDDFLRVWMKAAYVEQWRTVLHILLFGLLADGLASNAYRILVARARHGRCAAYWLVLAVLGVPIAIIGARHHGVFGVAFSLTVVAVVGSLITLLLACRVMEISIRSFCRQTLLRLLPALALLCTGLLISRHLSPVASYRDLAINISIPAMAYALLVWFFLLRGLMRAHRDRP